MPRRTVKPLRVRHAPHAAQGLRATPLLRRYCHATGCWLAVRKAPAGYVCSTYWQGMHHTHYVVQGARSARAALRAYMQAT